MDKYKILTNQGKAKYLAKLDEIGWFNNAQNKKTKIEKSINEISNSEFLMFRLSHIGFDAEGFDDSEDYKRLINNIIKFPFCNQLSAEVNQLDTTTISIKIKGGNNYELEIDTEESFGWFDFELIEFMNDIVFQNENIIERLFAVPPCDQTVDLVFISETLYELAIENGVFPDDMEYFM